ncbi:hypothetical protein OG21DRAFT_1498767 [Imleria badia]|nr:hypothetical protein OG21DRAFT_1498767 [Imleria badia]
MSHLLFWPTITFFYPVGNTSAVCLTENLSPESKADVLLLACGDPRHILYTIYANETNPLTALRTFDITCCDVDVAVLARNALLFTLLADDDALDKLDKLWNLFYHMFVDKTSLSILFEQCRKLVALAESAVTWRAGPYGHFLTACDAGTLAELRRMWTAYLDIAAKQAKRFEQRVVDGMKEMSERTGPRGTTTAARSAGPLALHANEVVSRQFDSYWSSGTTDDGAHSHGQRSGQKRRLSVNPTFSFSIDGDKFALHYGTDPLSGLHLAEAFASGKFTRPRERIPPHEMVRVAKDQFSRWCTSVSKRLKSSNPSSPTFVIRMFAGDALTFCQALKYCEYGRRAVSLAPLSFNVIDTSNILDHAGLVNVLVVTAPLLRKTPSATLYTEALLRTGDDPSQAILEHVCGDLATMALLLGIIPSTFISQFTTRSNVHETLTMSAGSKQYHERLAWKAIGFGGSRVQRDTDNIPTPPHRLCFDPEDLSAFLFRVYVHMFSDEDIQSRFQLLTLSPEHLCRTLQRSGVLHYTRRSFALLVHFIKTRVQTDWWRTMDLFEDMVLADGRLMTGQHAYQELCCHLHLLGVYTAEWLSVPSLHRLRLEYEGHTSGAGLFRDWTRSRIPQVVTLALVVPREAIARLERDFMEVGTPVLQCDMHDGPRQNWFAVTSATFGSLRVAGAGEHRTGVVVDGDVNTDADATQPPWRTGAPLIITFSVAASSVMDMARNPRTTVGLALRATVGVTSKFADRLGYDLTVFRTRSTDAERVFVLVRPPVVGTSASTAGDADVEAGSALDDHWRENVRGTLSSEGGIRGPEMPLGTSGDVHVQMNDMFSTVRSFTVRIDVTDLDARTALADTRTVPTVGSGSGSTRSLGACVKIGTHTFAVRFPLPVDAPHIKLRVARRSSYIEVVAPFASFDVRPERDLSNRFAPLSFGSDDDGTPTLGSIHRLNLDRCPTFKLPKGPSKLELDWCDLHVSLMVSELERKRATPESKAPEKVFALCDTSRGGEPHLYIIVAQMRLDVGSHTVVADTFVAPGTPAVRAALGIALRESHSQRPRKPEDVAVRYIATDADETAAWFHLLPRLTERCRTWPHKTSCVYRTPKYQGKTPGEQTLGTWGRQGSLCTCGAGVGTETLPKAFEGAAQYLTRAAFGPLFSVPYLKEVNVPVGGVVWKPRGPRTPATRGTALHDQNVDVGKTDTVGVGYRCRSCGKEGSLTCSRCKRARYCSKACQRAHWKEHKKDCGSAPEAVDGSDLA